VNCLPKYVALGGLIAIPVIAADQAPDKGRQELQLTPLPFDGPSLRGAKPDKPDKGNTCAIPLTSVQRGPQTQGDLRLRPDPMVKRSDNPPRNFDRMAVKPAAPSCSQAWNSGSKEPPKEPAKPVPPAVQPK
jgi:hypothetical protein